MLTFIVFLALIGSLGAFWFYHETSRSQLAEAHAEVCDTRKLLEEESGRTKATLCELAAAQKAIEVENIRASREADEVRSAWKSEQDERAQAAAAEEARARDADIYFQGIRIVEGGAYSIGIDGQRHSGWIDREDIGFFGYTVVAAVPENRDLREFTVSMSAIGSNGKRIRTLHSTQTGDKDYRARIDLYFGAPQLRSIRGKARVELALRETGEVLRSISVEIQRDTIEPEQREIPLVCTESRLRTEGGGKIEDCSHLIQDVGSGVLLLTLEPTEVVVDERLRPSLTYQAFHAESNFVGPVEELFPYEHDGRYIAKIDCRPLNLASGQWEVIVRQGETEVHSESIYIVSRHELLDALRYRQPRLIIKDLRGDFRSFEKPIFESEVSALRAAVFVNTKYPSALANYGLEIAVINGSKTYFQTVDKIRFTLDAQGIETADIPLPEVPADQSKMKLTVRLKLEDRVLIDENFYLQRESPRHRKFRSMMLGNPDTGNVGLLEDQDAEPEHEDDRNPDNKSVEEDE